MRDGEFAYAIPWILAQQPCFVLGPWHCPISAGLPGGIYAFLKAITRCSDMGSFNRKLFLGLLAVLHASYLAPIQN